MIVMSALLKRYLYLAFLLFIILTTNLAASSQKLSPAAQPKNNTASLIKDLADLNRCKELYNQAQQISDPNSFTEALIKQLLQFTPTPKKQGLNNTNELILVGLLHKITFCALQDIPIDQVNKRLDWPGAEELLKQRLESLFPPIFRDLGTVWINYLKSEHHQLGQLISIPYRPSESSGNHDYTYIKFEDVLLTPGQVSMWQHCKQRVEHSAPDWQLVLQSGYVSPAFQFIQFSKTNVDLTRAAGSYPPPGWGEYQSPVPGVRFDFSFHGEGNHNKPWSHFYKTCSAFGFEPSYPDIQGLEGEAGFKGIEALYSEIFSNPLIPANLARDLPAALKSSGFYPSPQGLRVILALSAQESTMQWNPKLNPQKKQLLRKRFDNALTRINDSVPGSVTSFFLSQKHKSKLEQLIKELHHLTDPNQDQSREYDFYLWSRKAYGFIVELTETYQNMATVGQWFFDLKSLNERLEKEPQTFGLWQININHLKEKIANYKQLRRAFPEIYQKVNDQWIVNSEWLIDALSGRSNARLNRRRTLELIIHTHLKPHYLNHQLGNQNDLLYFIAENMSGEMSTFRAAIQKQLNEKLRSSLTTDGDLTYYRPYSTRIDWKKTSNSYQKLVEFVTIHQYYFNAPVNPEKLVKDLCEASSWDELKQLELYQKLMDKTAEIRIFPDIRSSLYNQTPRGYARQVVRKSGLF